MKNHFIVANSDIVMLYAIVQTRHIAATGAVIVFVVLTSVKNHMTFILLLHANRCKSVAT